MKQMWRTTPNKYRYKRKTLVNVVNLVLPLVAGQTRWSIKQRCKHVMTEHVRTGVKGYTDHKDVEAIDLLVPSALIGAIVATWANGEDKWAIKYKVKEMKDGAAHPECLYSSSSAGSSIYGGWSPKG